jgi:hypothetical protein
MLVHASRVFVSSRPSGAISVTSNTPISSPEMEKYCLYLSYYPAANHYFTGFARLLFSAVIHATVSFSLVLDTYYSLVILPLVLPIVLFCISRFPFFFSPFPLSRPFLFDDSTPIDVSGFAFDFHPMYFRF